MHSNYGEQHNNKKKDYKKPRSLKPSNKTNRPDYDHDSDHDNDNDYEKLCIFVFVY
jgi:hypothetical protein